MKTVGAFIKKLQEFPEDWPIEIKNISDICIKHKEYKSTGNPFIAIYNSNGGSFGLEPLTEVLYKSESKAFLENISKGMLYTSVHGDHRLYSPSLGSQATCYGISYDRRVIERMVKENLIKFDSVDIERVRYSEGAKQ